MMTFKDGRMTISMDDLEMLTTVANICGYMEASEKIFVNDNTEMAEACWDIVNEFDSATHWAFVNNIDYCDWPQFNEFIETALYARFAPTHEE